MSGAASRFGDPYERARPPCAAFARRGDEAGGRRGVDEKENGSV